MAIDPVSAGLGAVSLISGKSAQKKAESQQKKAAKGEEAVRERALKAWDKWFNSAEAGDMAGQFDPEKQIGGLQKDYERDTKTMQENTAGAFRTAGYRPGDSEIGTNIREVTDRRGKDWDRLKLDIRRQSFLDKLQAYGSMATGSLGMAQNSFQNMGNQAQPPSSAGFLSAMSPFIGGGQKKASMNTGNWGWLKNARF